LKTYLMAIHIGPVQDFIAAARKLRDLWFGSYLLSELSKQAALSLQNNKADLIFPNPADAAKDLSAGSDMKVANKLLAQFATDDPCSQDFLEIYGAWVPLEDGGYIPARKRVDSLLTARKSLRDFSPAQHLPDWKDKGGLPKSSLDGGRESVLSPESREETKKKQGIKEHEELDAVGWIKRHGKKLGDEEGCRPAFDSLSDLAADPFLRGALKNPKAWTELEKLAGLFRRHIPKEDIPKIAPRYPGSALDSLGSNILFPSRIRIFLEEIETLEDNQEVKQEILKCIRSVHNIMETEPLQYAAILIGDGDNMGNTISSLKDKKRHKDFSRALDEFARTADGVVEDHMGNLIYSGGDDVLAFVPLDQALECAQALQQSFEKEMEKIFPGKTERPTFSIGMAIVHHIRPMGLSLETARRAEKLAKANPGKNSMAIILEKRSGAPIQINQHWESDFDFDFVKRLLDWTECHINDLLPDKFAYQIKILKRELGCKLEWKGIEPENSQAYEFLRILSRKRTKGGSKPLDDKERDKVLEAASTLKNLEDMANELIITRIFAQAKVQAGYKE